MPGQGTNSYASLQAPKYEPPEEVEQALRAGIRMFCVRYPKRNRDGYKQVVQGPIGVKVREEITPNGKYTHRARWLSGAEAHCVFSPRDRLGTLIGWIPDDKSHYNRVLLLDNRDLYEGIVEMHTEAGTAVSGGEVRMQLDCLGEVLDEDAPLYKVVSPTGSVITSFWDEDEAKEFIVEEVDKLINNGKSLVKIQPYKKCKIRQETGRRRRQKFVDMIQKYGAQYPGWTDHEVNPAFYHEVMVPVSKLIRSKLASGWAPTDIQRGIAPVDVSEIDRRVEERLSQMFKKLGLKPEDMSAVLNQRSLAEERQAAQEAAEKEVLGDERYEETDGQMSPSLIGAEDEKLDESSHEESGERPLNAMSKEELAGMARVMGIDTEGKKRNELIRDINAMQKQGITIT